MVRGRAPALAALSLLALLPALIACSGGGGGSGGSGGEGGGGGGGGGGDGGGGGTSCAAGTYGPSCTPCACGEHGTCDAGVAGTGACTCAAGWAGAACDACAPGHYGPTCAPCACPGSCSEGLTGDGACCGAGLQDNDGDGVCTPTCATAGLACVHGACGDASGTARCFCEPGWGGALCDVCDGTLGTVSGVVYAPQGTDPIPDALVYVPGAAVQDFAAPVACGCPITGSPVVIARTDVHGAFTLRDVPAGTNVPLVVQVGRWRRKVTIPTVAGCRETVVSASLTRLPRNHVEGDIPHLAVVTGSVDALECVLRKMGVFDSEFTRSDDDGRIHIYTGDDSPGATLGSLSYRFAESRLFESSAAIARYDGVLLACQEYPHEHTTAQKDVLVGYLNAGGRVFATHYTYTWLYQTPQLSSTATWSSRAPIPAGQTGYLDTSFPQGQALAQWLLDRGASSTLGQVPLQYPRADLTSVVPPARTWATLQTPAVPVIYSFDTPVGTPAAEQCGRVVFGNIHAVDGNTREIFFPAECGSGSMTPQEKLVEYLLFDLTRCEATHCAPRTCSSAGAACGAIQDGCGNVVQCGNCTAPAMCRANRCVRL